MEGWFETTARVRYQETDQMGVVYHSNYFVWFEMARTELIRSVGITYKEIEKTGLLLPVVDVSCNYKCPAKYDDELLIRVKISRYTGLRIEFIYEVICKASLDLLATGSTKHVFIDTNYKPKRLVNSVPDFHEKLLTLSKILK
ncbi:MAG: acyl-CoA thioesterase [Vulcanibacillus sp.]